MKPEVDIDIAVQQLTTMYKKVRRFLERVNPDALVATIDERLPYWAIQVHRYELEYGYDVYRVENLSGAIGNRLDIIVGYYIPEASPGDKLVVSLGGKPISTITINDPEKIYLPLGTEFIYRIMGVYGVVAIQIYDNNGAKKSCPGYVIGLQLRTETRNFLAMQLVPIAIKWGNKYLLHYYEGSILERHADALPEGAVVIDNVPGYRLFENKIGELPLQWREWLQEKAAIVIQRWWREWYYLPGRPGALRAGVHFNSLAKETPPWG